MSKFSKELIKGSTKNLILASLAEGELYGYQIVKEIHRLSGNALDMGEGTVYPTLHSLEKSGLLKSHWVNSENGRERKYYKLTRKGRLVLKTAMQEWKEFSGAIDSVFSNVNQLA